MNHVSVEQRLNNLARWRDAARKLSAARADLLPSLVQSTHLSRAGVDLGFDEHLEWNASAAELLHLVHSAHVAQSVAVVLSANVFTAPFRAIALALASAERVVVRPSSREPEFMTALAALAPDLFTLDRTWTATTNTHAVVHAYGRDETLATIRANLATTTKLVGHGSGFGVAVIETGDDLAAAADALARDIIPFDQRGCLSPRVAYVVGSEARANDFARELDLALATGETRTPRGDLPADEHAAITQFCTLLETVGAVRAAGSHVVTTAGTMPFVLPPTGRCMHITHVPNAAFVAEHLHAVAPYVTTIGTLAQTRGYSWAHGARMAALGSMQKPPFDGPVDMRPARS